MYQAKVIFFDTGYNVNSINVLAGALCEKVNSSISIKFVKTLDDLKKEVTNSDNPIIFAFSFTTFGFKKFEKELSDFIKNLKNIKTNIFCIAGGVHSTAKPRELLETGMHFVCFGEGEKTICEFVDKLTRGDALKNIKGLGWFEGNDIKCTGLSEPVNLDDYPPFCEPYKRFNPIEITRGCVYACSFCQTPFMFKARFRHRSVENICYYVEILKKYGLTDIRFITPSALSYGSSNERPCLEKVEELLSRIRKTLGDRGRIFFGTFPSEVRPEHISAQSLKILKKYVNNDNLVIGGQSGSDRILKQCHRGHNVESIIQAVRYCVEFGYIPNVDFIFGFPEETEEDVSETLKVIETLISLGARIHAHYFIPLPGSPYANKKPSRLSNDTRRTIERLISSGSMYGQWKQQEEFVRGFVSPGTEDCSIQNTFLNMKF
ncbi:MAG: TIGR04013 family B12-binding domain/radical SAM domain-containing protein [Limisphaerales bacterium]